MSPAEVDVVIVNWNTEGLLRRCLASLAASQGVTLHTVVVDNASSDDSCAMVKSEFPEVRLVENPENLGFAKANNLGIRLGQSRYVLLLNSDAFVSPDTVAGMVEAMETYPDTGAMGCRLVYEDGSLQRSCYSFPDLATEFYQATWLDRMFARSKVFGRYLMTWWEMDDFRTVDVVMGAVMLLRREALDAVGLLDESYFMYSEEVDLCYRLRRQGWLTRYLPSVQAVHIWGGSAKRVPVQTLIRLYQSRVHFFRKHYGRLTAMLYKALLWKAAALRAAGGYLGGAASRRAEVKAKGQLYARLLREVPKF